MSTAKLKKWLNAPREDGELDAILIDGIHFADHCVLIALGVTAQGEKTILGLHEGSTENATVARTLLTNLVTRGLDSSRPTLFGIDGSKALRKAIRDVWGDAAIIQRCQVHKMRNVLEHLPDTERPWVRSRMSKAYDQPTYEKAVAALERLARDLEREHPGAATSLREGLEETLTLQRLGIRGALFRTLRSTNAIENLNSSIATYTRNTKRWRGGSMILRWIAAALDHSQPRFRAVRGFSELPKLRAALDREIATTTKTGVQKAA
jgi:transposase-like protein